jgi:hypothetical protein
MRKNFWNVLVEYLLGRGRRSLAIDGGSPITTVFQLHIDGGLPDTEDYEQTINSGGV